MERGNNKNERHAARIKT